MRTLEISGVVSVTTLAATPSLAYLAPASGKSLRILRAHVGNRSYTTLEMQEWAFQETSAAGSVAGTDVTPFYTDSRTAYSEGGTFKLAITVDPTLVSSAYHWHRGGSNINGYDQFALNQASGLYVPDGGTGIVLKLLYPSNPGDFDAVVSIEFGIEG